MPAQRAQAADRRHRESSLSPGRTAQLRRSRLALGEPMVGRHKPPTWGRGRRVRVRRPAPRLDGESPTAQPPRVASLPTRPPAPAAVPAVGHATWSAGTELRPRPACRSGARPPRESQGNDQRPRWYQRRGPASPPVRGRAPLYGRARRGMRRAPGAQKPPEATSGDVGGARRTSTSLAPAPRASEQAASMHANVRSEPSTTTRMERASIRGPTLASWSRNAPRPPPGWRRRAFEPVARRAPSRCRVTGAAPRRSRDSNGRPPSGWRSPVPDR